MALWLQAHRLRAAAKEQQRGGKHLKPKRLWTSIEIRHTAMEMEAEVDSVCELKRKTKGLWGWRSRLGRGMLLTTR